MEKKRPDDKRERNYAADPQVPRLEARERVSGVKPTLKRLIGHWDQNDTCRKVEES